MDPISIMYTSVPSASRGPDRVCSVIAIDNAAQRPQLRPRSWATQLAAGTSS